MIRLVAGNPGSGKTYYAVKFVYDLLQKLKGKKKKTDNNDVKVLHNIDGLKIGTDLETFCEKNNHNPLELFTNSYHEDNNKFRGWLFIVDECQILFPKNLRDENVQRFFQKHRHFGIDVILLSQDYKLISPSISLLAEYQLRAVSDTANPLPKTFMYRKLIGWEKIGTKFLLKKQEIFDLYKTADYDQKKVKKKSRPMLILFIVCVLASLFGVFRLVIFKDSFDRTDSINKKESTFPQKTNQDRYGVSDKQKSNKYEDDQMYPKSYLEKLKNKVLLPLDMVEDSTGMYFLFMNTLWPARELPYKVIKTRLGYSALVPLDVFEYINNQKILLAELTPDHPDNQISDNSNIFTDKEKAKDPLNTL